MPVKTIKVNVSTPSVNIPRGRGFYQLEEEELYLPVIQNPEQKGRFFSYLESDNVSLQFDRDGHLIFIEVAVPRRRWTEQRSFTIPGKVRTADIHFLDFRDSLSKPEIFCNPTREILKLQFMYTSGPFYYLAENLIAQIDAQSWLAAIWVTDIIDDLAGREIAAWRKAIYGEKQSPLSEKSAFLIK
jgi:hypothetical protein